MKLSNEAQEGQFREIGAYLRQARAEKNISIEQVAMRTRIRSAFIEAMEEGRGDDLPEAVFVQGFIRRYCDAIEIDGTILTANFGDLFLPVVVDKESINIKKKSNLYIPLAVPYVLLLVGASLGLFYILSPKQNSEVISKKDKLTATITEQPAGTQKATPLTVSETPTPQASASLLPTATPVIPTPTASISPTVASASGVEVDIELQGESWLRVKVDGKTAFEGTLKKGDKKTWVGDKEVSVYSGNAGAVLVSNNKQPAVVMGSEGSLKLIKYTSESALSPTATPSPQ
ncbi:hypothetical protein NIES4101_33450 [Calothrix sp. NIES-4101]|nr:hypothetical protein NIES4101_33450 [Calothrix sp. NIES-4101]